MKTNYPLVVWQVSNELCITCTVFSHLNTIMLLVVRAPLQRLVITYVHLKVFFSVLGNGLFLGQTHAAIFKRSKNSGRHLIVVHMFGGSAKEAGRQEFASLDGHGGQFLPTLQDITNGKDVGDIRLFVGGRDFPSRAVKFYTCALQPQVFCYGISAQRKQHSVELLLSFDARLQVLPVNHDFVCNLLELGRDGLVDESRAVTLHVTSNLFRNLLIEPPQEDGPDHHSDITFERSKKSCRFERNVAGSDAQRFSWWRRE
mmetsp:Transcript_9867/g.60104  ORF Transcript_9867/g.60104 Transcript_9867/m.60104 type:complete len:258 (+) Transcript_9867:529-1302(+)